MITIRARCRSVPCVGAARADLTSAGAFELRCPRCGDARTVQVEPATVERTPFAKCPVCAGREFFVRKDFPQRLGLAIVISAALLSTVFFYQQRLLWVWAVLAAAVLIDAALYLVTRRVVVCYRCRAELRGLPYNPDIKPFDLATSEKYAEVK